MTLGSDVKVEDELDEKHTRFRHTYSDSVPKALPQETLESLPDWRERFPSLAKLHDVHDLKYDVLHMDVLLELRNGRAPPKAELWGRFELLVPGEHDRRVSWRCTQSLYKPHELYGPAKHDPPYENVISEPQIQKFEPGRGTHLQISFPCNSWAYIFQSLSSMEEEFDAAARDGIPYQQTQSARQYIDQISMYQEFSSRTSSSEPWKRQAVMLWTFRKCRAGEKGVSSWRYLNPSPSRNTLFSPHPGPGHVAPMAENFNCWTEPQPLLQPTTNFDHILHDLATPPSTIMQSPFPSYGYGTAQHDLAAESLSFMSQDTQDSDSTLVDQSTNAHMDSFLSTAGVTLGDFDHSSNLWTGTPSDGFDNDTSFLASYNAVPSNGSQIWDGGDAKQHQGWVEDDAKQNPGWVDGDASFGGFDGNISQRLK